MKKLEKEFKKWNFIFTQVKREGKYAIYEKFFEETSIGFEVIIIQKQKEHERFGQVFPAKELYPSSEAWGKYGWTFTDFRDAITKFKSMAVK